MIIGMSGFAGSGKDTAADYLVDKYGFVKKSLADPLKEACKSIFDFTDEQLWGPSGMREKEDFRYPFTGVCVRCHNDCARAEGRTWYCSACDVHYPLYVTPRLALQTLGTEWGRTLYSNVWVDKLIRSFESNKHYVVSDVRFRNEMRALLKTDGILIRLWRSDVSHDWHQSEAELAETPADWFRYHIQNYEGKEHLYNELDKIMHTHYLPK